MTATSHAVLGAEDSLVLIFQEGFWESVSNCRLVYI
jgi:hypothetical protein